MNCQMYGNSGQKILIIHGWMHSSKRYTKLAQELCKDCEVTLLDLPGFGGTDRVSKKKIIDKYVLELTNILESTKFDLIISHSLGCNILLKALDNKEEINSAIILSNPAYFGISHLKVFALLIPINIILFYLQKTLPLNLMKPFIKLVALVSVNKFNLIDDIIIEDSRNSDPITAAVLMYELAFDKWRVGSHKNWNVLIIMSEYDRIIDKKKVEMLNNDLGNCKMVMLEKIGHTAVLENYEDFLKTVRDLLRR